MILTFLATLMAGVLATTEGKPVAGLSKSGQTCDNVTVTLFPAFNPSNPCDTSGIFISMLLEREQCYAFKAAAIAVPSSLKDSDIALSPNSNSCTGPVQIFPMQAGDGYTCITMVNDDGTPHTPMSGYWSCIAGYVQK